MKITKRKLKQIIKEELDGALAEEENSDQEVVQMVERATASFMDTFSPEELSLIADRYNRDMFVHYLFENIELQIEDLADQTSPEVSVQPGPDDPMDDDDDEIPMMEEEDSFSKAGEEIEKKGTEGVFTAKAKKRGMTAQEFARKVLANTDKYDIKSVRQASFAKGADTVAKKNKK